MTVAEMPRRAAGGRRIVVLSIWAFVWSVALLMGLLDVAHRNVPAYPNAIPTSPIFGQVGLYLAIPSLFVLMNLLLLTIARRVSKVLVGAAIVAQLFFAMAFLFMATGGI